MEIHRLVRFAIEAPSDWTCSPILVLCYKQVKGNLNENLTADQMSLGGLFALCTDVANKW